MTDAGIARYTVVAAWQLLNMRFSLHDANPLLFAELGHRI
jgi:hypothetical protein